MQTNKSKEKTQSGALDLAKLQIILQAGDATAVAKFFGDASEVDREKVALVVKDWCQRLERNWRAQFDKKAKAQISDEGSLPNWNSLMPTAYLAALASLGLKQIAAIHLVTRPSPAMIAETLRARHPAWLDEYVNLICSRNLSRWSSGSDWKLVRQLVRDKLCEPPQHDNYALGAIEGIKPPSNWRENMLRKDAGLPPLPEPTLVDLLLAERDWLDTAFWQLFEIEGTGEISLANAEKYGSAESWTSAIVELSQRGVLSRDRLLDASLAALNRDFIQFRVGWFSRFHEAMSPTTEERGKRLSVYFQLLGSAIPPTVTFALKAIQSLDKDKPIAGAQLAKHLESVLTARSKVAVNGALQLLERAVRREKTFGESAARLAAHALLHDSPEVQEKALVLLEKHGRTDAAELRAKLAEVGEHIAPSLRKRPAPWFGKSVATVSAPPSVPYSAPSRLDTACAIKPITTLDELILGFSAIIESPENPNEIERVLDGLSRLCGERPPDFNKRVGPLRKRTLKKRDDKRGSYPTHPALDRALAMLALTWTDDKDGFIEEASVLGYGQNHFAFILRRLRALGEFVRGQNGLPLLSAPTHMGGWIDPWTLVERWVAWQKAAREPELHEQVLALLRLAPENRPAALPKAREVSNEQGEALRFALGGDGRTGKNSALWLAAWRSRQPHGDLPEFEKSHPKLGPDAGVAARYEWEASSLRSEHGDLAWSRLEFEIAVSPQLPAQIGDADLPVLFHGKWNNSLEDEKQLLRWAATLWPAQREAFFSRGVKPLAWAVNYADANDRDVCAFLEPLAEPHTEMLPLATLALALGLAAEDAALRGHAQEGLIAAISQHRLDVPGLAGVMSRLLATGVNKFARWSKTLREAARVSPLHAAQIADVLRQALRGDPAKAPRDIHALLELLVELLAETNRPLEENDAQQYLRGIKTGGRTAKLVRKLLS